MAPKPQHGEQIEITVSAWTIVTIVAVIGALWLLYLLRPIIGMVLIAFLIAAIISPGVAWFERKRIPRPIGILIIYIASFTVIGIILALIIPPLIQEISSLAGNFSALWSRVTSGFSLIKNQPYYTDEIAQTVTSALGNLESILSQFVRGAFFAVTGAFGGIVSFLLILVLAFYMMLQGTHARRFLSDLIPAKYRDYGNNLVIAIQHKIIAWSRGQTILSLTIAVLSYIGLLIIRVDYALVLALFAGITEFIPYAGPLLGGLVAVLFALAQSPFHAFLVAIMFIVIQQLENHILVPKVMQRSVGLNPILSITALLIGARLGGILGVLFAIPAATACDVIVRDLLGEDTAARRNQAQS